MANNARPQTRTRIGAQRRVNGDENATSKHLRQSSGIAAGGASRAAALLSGLKGGPQRPALGEVTTTAVNRKDVIKASAKENLKNGVEQGLKRTRSSSLAAATGPQRVPAGPGRTETATTTSRTSTARAQKPSVFKRMSRQETAVPVIIPTRVVEEKEIEMDIEHVEDSEPEPELVDMLEDKDEQDMVGVQETRTNDESIQQPEAVESKSPRVWPDIDTEKAMRHYKEVTDIQRTYHDEVDIFDTTMVSEYSDEIFKYMSELEDDMMPNPDYMDGQNEITWSMRQTLVDWLLQVHLRWHMLPETLWIAINIVDRFLTRRVVSLVKLQLVGVTAMFIAAKYEEILAPSVDEFVFMTENGYTKEEILKGERIVLQTLDFKISQYCSPYSWMRKISKADDYDIQTRTLGKFLAEVTLLDHRFLRCKPSLVAAVAMYSARKMLGGDWNEAFVYQSGFVAEHLETGHQWICEKLLEDNFVQQYACQKYAHKKFLKASLFAIEWAKNNFSIRGEDDMMLKK
ncbi:cyclin [Boletus reticuloceps]|uniref:Cyclin n=1 Tax=Boletus reticuloceps TaxID=495285 RepID=A0A8I3A8Z6_9AGAM|nr:cyclin [Boletus reticuloceps]